MQKELSERKMNAEILNGLLDAGVPKNVLASQLKVSIADIEKATAELVPTRESVEKYREVQHLKLTMIQSKILDGMTEDKIEAASLTELAKAFATLKDKELVMQGKATAITGIVGYLIQLEKEEQEKETSKIVDITPTEEESFSIDAEFTTEEPLPRL